MWLQTWDCSGDGRALLLLLCGTSLYILAPTEGEKVPGYNSPLRPTGSVQRAYGTQTLFRGECRWVGECDGVGEYACVSSPSLSPLFCLFLSAMLRLKSRTFNTVHNCSTTELHPNNAHLSQPFLVSPWMPPTSPCNSIGHLCENQAAQ